eukprot:2729674-Amphidinium_carterae.1
MQSPSPSATWLTFCGRCVSLVVVWHTVCRELALLRAFVQKPEAFGTPSASIKCTSWVMTRSDNITVMITCECRLCSSCECCREDFSMSGRTEGGESAHGITRLAVSGELFSCKSELQQSLPACTTPSQPTWRRRMLRRQTSRRPHADAARKAAKDVNLATTGHLVKPLGVAIAKSLVPLRRSLRSWPPRRRTKCN